MTPQYTLFLHKLILFFVANIQKIEIKRTWYDISTRDQMTEALTAIVHHRLNTTSKTNTAKLDIKGPEMTTEL